MTQPYYFTKRGLEAFKERIRNLEGEAHGLRGRLAEAAETGGNQYHDNASYEQLTADIRILDRELAEACETLGRAQVVEPPTAADAVCIGTTVHVRVNPVTPHAKMGTIFKAPIGTRYSSPISKPERPGSNGVNGAPEIWRIVGYGESDPARKAVAYNTPLAQLVFGKKVGETVKGSIAGRAVEIKILEINREKDA